MIGLYSQAQVRAAEAALAATVAAGSLMEKASYGLAQAVIRMLRGQCGGVYGARVALLVGPGGNGGDALHAGRFLRARGVAVTAVCTADRTYPGAAEAFRDSGGLVVGIADADAPRTVQDADLVVDGISGLASGRAVRLPSGVAAALAQHACVVAVDIPTGVACDTGIAAIDAIQARHTVSFGSFKPAHFLAPGAAYCGTRELVDIGLGPFLPPATAGVLSSAEVWDAWPRQPYDGHKYATGVVGLIAGSAQYAGAAVLAAGGASRAKPGMVRYVGPRVAADRVLERWPEVVVHESFADAGRAQSWVIGPGLGTDERAADLVDAALDIDVPLLIDADALTLMAGRLGRLRDRAAPTVLTPHRGEFERLFFPVDDPLSAATRAARESGCVVLLKGPTTVVAGPAGPALISPTGSPRLATAGTGDVLAGIIGALLAAGIDARRAAAMGAYAHGAAARRAAGPIVAGDLPDLLVQAVSARTASGKSPGHR